MGYAIITRAMEIIFLMEGKYTSVNPNDNGALSIGACQWHGNRAKALLKTIVTDLIKQGYFDAKCNDFIKEICSTKSWTKRILTTVEKDVVKTLLSFKESYSAQDKLASKDVQGYINHIVGLGICEEETIILLADIENQGGAGATTRIVKQALKDYGEDVTLDEMMVTALQDKVFKNYQERRFKVYKALTGRNYNKLENRYVGYYTVKKNENLTLIAKRLGTTVNAIVHDNKIADPDIIHEGQRLKIVK